MMNEAIELITERLDSLRKQSQWEHIQGKQEEYLLVQIEELETIIRLLEM